MLLDICTRMPRTVEHMSEPSQSNLYPVFEQMIPRADRERRFGQRGCVVWLYGLSGSGKSTIANTLEHALFEDGYVTQLLDGDNIRTGLNRDLGFSEADRTENIRRIAEVAKLFAQSGIIVFASFITPLVSMREQAIKIIGKDDFMETYVHCSYEQCAERDPKGLYAKVAAGEVASFTGKDAEFQLPEKPDLWLDTEHQTVEQSVKTLHDAVLKRICLS